MPVFGSPLWLVAGALAALAPIVLHLITPRPPARTPLPTARFLEPHARTRRHLARVPRDVPLLLLRCAFLLLVAGALAAPRLLPARDGTADIVLLDASVAGDSAFMAMVRTRTGDAAVVVPFEGSYAAALRRLPRLAIERTRADSVRAWWVTPPRWRSWTPGTSTLRPDAWPGAMGLIQATPPNAAAAAEPAAASITAVVAAGAAGDAVRAAFVALGHDARTAGSLADAGDAHAIIIPDGAADSAHGAALARSGATVVLGHPAEPTAGTLAADGVLLRDAAGGAIVAPRDARVVAAWADGGIAAFARTEGTGCVVRTGIALDDARTTASPEFPALLDRLVHGCEPAVDPAADVPLDGGALALLTGGESAAPVAVTSLPELATAGVPLDRWLLLAALAVALLEWRLAARRDRGTPAAPAGTARA